MNVHPIKSTPLILSGREVTAVLGPTNTGKTHLAIERMVAHDSGVIGLPLRLLAREVYGRVSDKVGAANVALITGEEKIQPPGARYSVCTVEAMPRRTDASFVAIDEVQIAGDLERGHIFTDRILHLRGRQETLLLGAATMRGILEKLLKGISVVTRPRMSHLAYAGQKKITRLPRRSAIVAFSADEVYGIAELIRRQRGGAAVVLGALSPRTRNKQVEIYQSGDVDFLVATDAIGMGLNLDVDHVAFAQNRKFDGYQNRELSPAEIGQIAGRAGRHLRDGTFGVTGQVDPLEDELVRKIEGHEFDPVRVLQWRTADFDFAGIDALKRSLDQTPAIDGLTRALPAVDAQALEHVSQDAEIRALADSPARVELLWDACALPDYRKIAPAQHADLIASIYSDLARLGHVDEAYMAEQVRRADSADGDIDALSQRIAQIRTWTFVSHRPGWLADPTHWQEKTREIEDRLSDALHERLTKRFVDRRTSVLMRRLRENTMLEAEINPVGEVLVEGHHVGELQGFRFTADQSADGEDAKAVRLAAQKALATEFDARAERFAASGNSDLALGSDGVVRWIGAPVATLVSGEDTLKPRAVLLADEQLTGPARDKVAARIERFVGFQVESLLKPLADLRGADQLSGIARGVAFRLLENLGVLNRRDVAEEIKSLDQSARAALRRLGVRFGAYHIFLPALLKPGPAGLLTLLWALANDGKERPGFGDVVNSLATGRTSLVVDPEFEKEFYRLAGYRLLGRRAVRVDILERLADLIRPALAWRPGTGARPEGGYDGRAFMVTPAMMSILGASGDDMEEVLKALGYRGDPKPAQEIKARLEEFDAAAEAEAARKAAEAEAAKHAAEAETTAAQPALEAAGNDDDEQMAAPDEATDIDASSDDAVDAGKEAVEDAEEPAATGPAETSDEQAAASDPVSQPPVGDTASSQVDSEAPAETPEAVPPATAVVAEAPAGEADGAAANMTASTEAEPEAADTTQPPPGSEPPAEPEEPKPVMLWRPGHFGDRERHRQAHHRRGRKHGGAAEQVGVEASDQQARPGGQNRDGRSKRRFQEKFAVGNASGAESGNGAAGGKPDGRPNFQRDKRGGAKPADRPAFRQREERPAKFDPDSPFAKLAALRDQLKK